MKGFVRFITFLIFISIVLLAFLFAVNNTTEVSLWLGRELPALSVGVLIITAFILGGVIGLFLGIGIFKQLKTMAELRQLRKKIARLESSGGYEKNSTGQKL